MQVVQQQTITVSIDRSARWCLAKKLIIPSWYNAIVMTNKLRDASATSIEPTYAPLCAAMLMRGWSSKLKQSTFLLTSKYKNVKGEIIGRIVEYNNPIENT